MNNKKFKFNASRVFLTYPQCTLSKESIREGLSKICELKAYCIALERHEDGSPHLHAYIEFTRKVHRDSERAFDIEDFHPNIQGVKNATDKERILKYVKKGDDYDTNITDILSKRDLLASTILEEGLTPEVIRKNPSIIFCNYTSLQAWTKFYTTFSSKTHYSPSDSKKIHYWIYGPSNSGKTYWLRALLRTWDGAEIPQNNDYSTITPTTNLIWSDEYKGCLTIQQLNRCADGYTTLNTKGGSVYLRRAVVVILSNFCIADVYKNVTNDILDTLYNRFNEYDLLNTQPRFPVYKI